VPPGASTLGRRAHDPAQLGFLWDQLGQRGQRLDCLAVGVLNDGLLDKMLDYRPELLFDVLVIVYSFGLDLHPLACVCREQRDELSGQRK
jgi:hypothetical protein